MENSNGEPVVLIVPPAGFAGAPFLAVVSRLQDAGVPFVAASEVAGICRATDGVRVTASRAFDYPGLLELPALIVFGDGEGWLARSASLRRLLARAVERGMIIGAVGRGVATLAGAGLLHGREVAAEPALDELLLRAGAVPLRTAVVLSERIITATDVRAGTLADELLNLAGVRPLPIELR
jgi:putative intracellular protease/amidase